MPKMEVTGLPRPPQKSPTPRRGHDTFLWLVLRQTCGATRSIPIFRVHPDRTAVVPEASWRTRTLKTNRTSPAHALWTCASSTRCVLAGEGHSLIGRPLAHPSGGQIYVQLFRSSLNISASADQFGAVHQVPILGLVCESARPGHAGKGSPRTIRELITDCLIRFIRFMRQQVFALIVNSR